MYDIFKNAPCYHKLLSKILILLIKLFLRFFLFLKRGKPHPHTLLCLSSWAQGLRKELHIWNTRHRYLKSEVQCLSHQAITRSVIDKNYFVKLGKKQSTFLIFFLNLFIAHIYREQS